VSKVNQTVHLACNFKYIIEAEGVLKVTGSYEHCKKW